MKKTVTSILTMLFVMVSLYSHAQFVSIVSNKFVVNGNTSCPIYFNGSNNPWEAWNDFGGSYNVATWNQDMINLKNDGINSARIWFSCDGNGQPSISSSGVASAPTAAFWQNCDSLFASAQRNGVYIMATMMSFDHTKNANTNSSNWQNMLNSSANVTTYINNYLVPFVNRYKTNPYLWSIDICNEIEWIYENGASSGGGNWTGATYPILQRFVAMCAAGIHNNPRTDGTTVLATVGSASVKWNGATEVQETSSGPGTSGANSTGNKWSDANLMAQNGNVANGILDFYSPHYYGWMEQYYSSPFENTPAAFGMSEKPCVVGEMPSMSPVATDISGYPITTMTLTTAFNNLQSKGWQGHQPWTANLTSNLTAEVGDLANFGSFAFAFYNANKTLVKPSCSTCATVAPTVSTPVTYCQNATASALTATGTSLLWYTVSSGGTGSSTAPTPTTTAAGSTSYYVSQTLNGCEGSRAAITVTVNALPTVSAGSNVSICTGKSTVLTATGGTSYKWSNSITTAANTVSPTVTTTYSVTGTNANGCSATASAIVTVNSIPTVTLTASSGSICNGASSVLTAAGATTYAWSSGTANPQTVSPTATTTYTVTGTTNGCTGIASTTVTVNAKPTVSVSPATATVCKGVSTSLTASGATTYLWSTAATTTGVTVTPATTTTYTVTGTSSGCTGTASAPVTVTAIPTVTLNASTGSICNGASSVLTAAGATTYAWSSGTVNPQTVSPTATTTYTVTGTTNGCTGIASTTVTVNAKPTVSVSPTTASVCKGASTSLIASGATTYLWSTAATTTGVTVTPATTTTYTVTGTANGCTGTASAPVTVTAIPTVTLNASTGNICNGASSVLTAAGATTYAWSSGTANPQTVSPTATTTYTVTGTTNGCNGIASTTVTVTVVPSAPNVTSPISYTTSATATALTASGTNLSWYSVASGGTGSSTAPIPSTANVGSTNYYVSQTINTCESPRAIIVVNVSQVNVTQTISLSQGWNIVSFNVLPTDSTVATIFGTLGTTLLTVKDQDGFYDPSQSSIFNSLLTISKSKGYLVDVSQVATLSVVGVPLNTASINLSSGWNLIGYPKQASTAISSELSGIWTPFVSIKNFDGFYQKGGTLNSLTNFVPGLGYFINVSSSCTLNY